MRRARVRQIRARLPDAAITADAIVGFPGETEEQFQNTLKLMEEVMPRPKHALGPRACVLHGFCSL
eukprot:1920058-Pleurochrysis_carterae.AAC.2